ncbi:hypothetical protein [Lentilactobacillus kisonensis]|uniref:Uncharacterized protein n=2 Tax=Lentilactobacillus kisonensis TaxID=481722 RepID=H1LHA5_9LACO|nr:hypothetical protein [Lentilactobacillus kisonensis]EHO50530.1 hypothetical protein HMPREF9104_01995 [Lentilactobacillus kisonensis F0435]KRL21469.1 hypothetical protein FC98_GL000804 [Lentilactobacillus kisonensis DSM 19906 = JCM 15041]
MAFIYIVIALLAALAGALVQVRFKWHKLTMGQYSKFLALTSIIGISLYVVSAQVF